MIPTTIKLILRKLLRNKLNTSIIIGGLAIGMAVCLLITLYVDNELNYDKHFKDYERIYRVVTSFKTGDEVQNLALAPLILGTYLKEDYPEIIEVAKVSEMSFTYNLKYKDKTYIQEGIRDASPEIFNVFSYHFLLGNPENALKSPNAIVLTETTARKIFGDIDKAMGETLLDDGSSPITVTGVIEDIPKNSDMQFTALESAPFTGDEDLMDLESHIYVKTKESNVAVLSEILEDVIQKKYKELLNGELKDVELKISPQPLEDLHFSEELLGDNPKGNKASLYIFSLIALFVLIIVCVNYVNLSLAMISRRIYHTGICRIAGAKKRHLIKNNIAETLIITTFSLILAVVVTGLSLPFLNNLTSKDIELSALYRFEILLGAVTGFLFINFVTGFLPSLALNKIAAIEFIKKANKLRFMHGLRKPLVISQFVISIVMISGLLVFQNQLYYLKNKDLGYQQNDIVALSFLGEGEKIPAKAKLLVDKLRQTPDIQGISVGEGGSFFGANHGGQKEIFADEINGNYKQFVINYIDVDEDFIDLLGIELLEGRNFAKTSTEENTKDQIIINESYAKAMELGEQLCGKKTRNGETVIGLVKDFHFTSLLNKIEPACFRFKNQHPSVVFAKIKPEKLAQVKDIWEKHIDGYPFMSKYLADNYIQGYKNKEKELAIIKIFTVISILTTCIGLLGLILFILGSRIKEIGIRKVNGAKISEIVLMLNSNILKWVLMAFVIATPIAWYAMSKWLENFVYKTELSWWVFALAGFIALFIALATVSWQSWRAARRNPVEALRYE